MSDGGPDNIAATTHAFHWLAVHIGVFQRLEWVRLLPKHSHNFADRTFSMIKEVVWPKRGAGGGCHSPWDMQQVLQKALSSQTAPVELVWQMQNLDWNNWFKDLNAISKDFGGFSDFRHWVYEVSDVCDNVCVCPSVCVLHDCGMLTSMCHCLYVAQFDPMLPEHGCVRVHCKESLHDTESDAEPWHPLKRDDDGALVTDPKGLMFMSEGIKVDLSKPVQPEKWKHGDIRDAEGLTRKDVWKKTKVMSDIIDHLMLPFSPEQQDQWRAIKYFHERYTRSNEVPNLPLVLRPGMLNALTVAFVMRHLKLNPYAYTSHS